MVVVMMMMMMMAVSYRRSNGPAWNKDEAVVF